MKKLDLLIEKIDGRVHAAVMSDSRLFDLYVDAKSEKCRWASLYLGRVDRIDKKLDAAFIDLGADGQGFLPAKHSLGAPLKAGQMVAVQVKSEAHDSDLFEIQKLPRLTMKLYVPGRAISYFPLSDQIEILRPSAEKASKDEVNAESKLLKSKWDDIQAALKNAGTTPCLVKMGSNAVKRALIDYLGSADVFKRIESSDAELLAVAKRWIELRSPTLARATEFAFYDRAKEKKLSLFDFRDIGAGIEGLDDAVVPIGKAGTLIIEHTNAFTVIDVNRGGAENTVTLNRDAAEEIALHVRLRSLSGAILIDFINMDLKSDRFKVQDTLQGAFDGDAGSAQIHGFTRLGILEMTRKRRSASLREKLQT